MSDKDQSIVPVDVKLWQEIGEDYDLGIKKIAERRGLKTSSVLAAAILDRFGEDSFQSIYLENSNGAEKAVFKTSRERIGRYFSERKTRILGYGILIFLLFLIALSVRSVWQAHDETLVVSRRGGFAAYERISEDDVRITSNVFWNNPLTDPPQKIAGRYVLVPLPQGSKLAEENLLSAELSDQMNGRAVLRLPVKAENAGNSIAPNSKISLIFHTAPSQMPATGKSSEKTAIIDDVVLLGIEKNNAFSTLVTGVTERQFQTIQDNLGFTDIYLVKN